MFVFRQSQSSRQIHAHGLALPRLRIDADLEGDRLANGDFIAFAQGGYVKENIIAAVIWLDESKALVIVEHLDLAVRHAVLWVFHDFDLDPTVEKIAAVVEAAEREREDISAGIAQPANTRPRTAIATSAMIASSNSFSAIEKGVRFLVLAPHVGQAIADVLIGPPHSLQVVIAILGIQDGACER
jgi:hypothetical protein